MLELMKAGQLPGDPTSSVNTILDLLSPSATRDYVEQTQPFLPTQLGQTVGALPEEAMTFGRQALGLETSPGQELEYQAALAKAEPDYMNAVTRQGELEVSKREVGVKEATERRNREEFERWSTGTPQEQHAMLQTSIGMMAMYGMGPNGQKVDEATRKKAEQLYLRQREHPEMLPLLSQLLRQGDETSLRTFAQLSGLPVEVYNPWFGGPRLQLREGVTDEEGAMLYFQQGMEEVLRAEEEARGLQ
jgi:hypothetical protein